MQRTSVCTDNQQTSEGEPLRFTHQQILKILSGILLGIFLAAIDQTVVIPAVPAIAADLHGFDHLAWIVSAYLLTSTAMTPIYGKLSDIYGRRILLLIALGVFALASALCAVSANLWQLVAARALQGVGGAGLMAMAQAAIADVVSPRERGRYQGYMSSAWGIASVAGPIIGGWVTDALSWRWIFWMNLPIALLAMLLCDRALRLLVPRGRRGPIDWLGATLLAGAISTWLLVMSWGGVSFPWTSPEILTLCALGAVLTFMVTRHERAFPDPLLPPRLFANAVFVRGVAIAFCGALALFGGSFLLPLFFQLVRHVDASASGALVVPFLGANCLGAYAAGQLARRHGKMKAILLAGLGGCMIGFVLLAQIGATTPVALLEAEQLLLGLGLGMVMPSSLVSVQNAADHRDVGTATGCILFLRSMGGAFGSTLVGALLVSGFASRLAAIGITAHIDLDELNRGSGVPGVSAAMLPHVQAALAGAFHVAFLACAVAMLVAILIAVRMRDLPLRTSAANEPAAEPAALAH
jgi:EmrB/QacA subfamily drug resistance transporter